MARRSISFRPRQEKGLPFTKRKVGPGLCISRRPADAGAPEDPGPQALRRIRHGEGQTRLALCTAFLNTAMLSRGSSSDPLCISSRMHSGAKRDKPYASQGCLCASICKSPQPEDRPDYGASLSAPFCKAPLHLIDRMKSASRQILPDCFAAAVSQFPNPMSEKQKRPQFALKRFCSEMVPSTRVELATC